LTGICNILSNGNNITKNNKILFLLPVLAVLLFIFRYAQAGSGFTANHKWAISENAGWLNASTTAEKLVVSKDGVTGYLWGENIGWIKFDYDGMAGAANTSATDWGVVNDGCGNLSGYAWGENIGWVNFDPAHSQVVVDHETGSFSGYAWAENIGWIQFGHPATDYTMDHGFTPGGSEPGMLVEGALQLEGTVIIESQPAGCP
jgi:hypothetical protein